MRAVFGVAERLGVVEFELDLAVRDRGVSSQHFAHTIGVGAVDRHRAPSCARVEQPQRDRLLQAGEDLPRAGRQRVDVPLRQIELRACASRASANMLTPIRIATTAITPMIGGPEPCASSAPPSGASTITVFRNSQNPMNEAK